jgi:hypothetical protein
VARRRRAESGEGRDADRRSAIVEAANAASDAFPQNFIRAEAGPQLRRHGQVGRVISQGCDALNALEWLANALLDVAPERVPAT